MGFILTLWKQGVNNSIHIYNMPKSGGDFIFGHFLQRESLCGCPFLWAVAGAALAVVAPP